MARTFLPGTHGRRNAATGAPCGLAAAADSLAGPSDCDDSDPRATRDSAQRTTTLTEVRYGRVTCRHDRFARGSRETLRAPPGESAYRGGDRVRDQFADGRLGH